MLELKGKITEESVPNVGNLPFSGESFAIFRLIMSFVFPPHFPNDSDDFSGFFRKGKIFSDFNVLWYCLEAVLEEYLKQKK